MARYAQLTAAIIASQRLAHLERSFANEQIPWQREHYTTVDEVIALSIQRHFDTPVDSGATRIYRMLLNFVVDDTETDPLDLGRSASSQYFDC